MHIIKLMQSTYFDFPSLPDKPIMLFTEMSRWTNATPLVSSQARNSKVDLLLTETFTAINTRQPF